MTGRNRVCSLQKFVMKCPRCHAEVPDGPECAACGVIVEKFLARKQQAQVPAPAVDPLKRPSPAAVVAGRPEPVRAPVGPGRVSDRKLIGLYGQLGRMLQAGLSTTEALRLAAANTRGAVSTALDSIRTDVEAGQTFAQATARQPGLFGESSQVLIEAGEVTGAIPAALQALSSAAELRLDIRRQIIRACIYPFVLFSLVFFVPKAHLLFTAGWGAYLLACLVPYLTTLAVLVGVVWALPKGLALVLGRDNIRRLVRGIPVFCGLYRLGSTVRFARHLGGAIEAGLPMPSALRLAARATDDPRWIESLAASERVLQQGGTLHESLTQAGLFDHEFLLATAAGERSGRLTDALEQHARLVQSTLTHRINVSVQLLAVVILLLTYFFVASAVVSEFESIMGGTGQQMEELLKELGGPAGASRLPPELKDILK